VYRRFGEVAAGTSPLYERVAVAVSESGEALRAEATGELRFQAQLHQRPSSRRP